MVSHTLFKKILRNGVGILLLVFFVLLFLTYFGQNSLSLMLNLGTTVPNDLKQIKIVGERSPRFLIKMDNHFFASCKTSRQSFMKWLRTSGFEVVVFSNDSLGKQIFITNYDSLPKKITNCEIRYDVQLSPEIADAPILYVIPIDNQNVLLKYDFDWN
jgi:hypothetical protein